MLKQIAVVTALVIISTTKISAAVILPSLPPGSQYQLIFVTLGTTTGTDSNIIDYDNFVTAQADLNPVLDALNTTWTALASTPFANAINASYTTSTPIYDTHSDKLEPTFPDLFTDYSSEGPLYTQYGISSSSEYVWTGTVSGGVASPNFSLGTRAEFQAIAGTVGGTNIAWLTTGIQSTGDEYPVYAISAPITVPEPVPEPTSFALMCSALFGLIIIRKFKHV